MICLIAPSPSTRVGRAAGPSTAAPAAPPPNAGWKKRGPPPPLPLRDPVLVELTTDADRFSTAIQQHSPQRVSSHNQGTHTYHISNTGGGVVQWSGRRLKIQNQEISVPENDGQQNISTREILVPRMADHIIVIILLIIIRQTYIGVSSHKIVPQMRQQFTVVAHPTNFGVHVPRPAVAPPCYCMVTYRYVSDAKRIPQP